MEMKDVKMSDRVLQVENLMEELILPVKNYSSIYLVGSSLGGYLASIIVRDSNLFRERLSGAAILCPAVRFPFYYMSFVENNAEYLQQYENGEKITLGFEEEQIFLSKEIVEDSLALSF